MALRKCISWCIFNLEQWSINRTLMKHWSKQQRCNQEFTNINRSYARMSQQEVTVAISAHQHSEEINVGSVKSFDTNQLPSNSPVEDSRAEARCLLTTGVLFGVFDGHGGPACGQVVAKRLLNYIAASLLPRDVLLKIVNPEINEKIPVLNLLEPYNDRFELVEDLQNLYTEGFQKYLLTLSGAKEEEFLMTSVLEKAFLSLDEDISKEAQLKKPDPKNISEDALLIKTLSVAVSGAVACVAHVDGEHLHIANCGDCRAVLGVWNNQNETWVAKELTNQHNAENPTEVSRITSEHPEAEKDTVIRNERLLGQLAPLRAFGDVRFKWNNEDIREYIVPLLGEHCLVPANVTPPYLTAKPEVVYHKLRAKDNFIILATDGLWDVLSPSQAVHLVGEHMSGKTVLSPFKLPEKIETTIGEIHGTLSKRMESMKLKPMDVNAATHLIRHALGGTDHGLDHNKISHLLTLPDDSARLFRDDISATVVFFDTDFLAKRPL